MVKEAVLKKDKAKNHRNGWSSLRRGQAPHTMYDSFQWQEFAASTSWMLYIQISMSIESGVHQSQSQIYLQCISSLQMSKKTSSIFIIINKRYDIELDCLGHMIIKVFISK